jgi:uncharacterized repeat protein (TIGR01451 family)
LAFAISSAPSTLFVGATYTNTISVTNFGPVAATGVTVSNTLPAGANVISASLSQGSYTLSPNGVLACNLGTIAAGSNARVTVGIAPTLGETAFNTASVSANESDLDLSNNSAQTLTTINSPIPARLSSVLVQSNLLQFTLTAQPGFAYRIQGSTNISANWIDLTNVTLNNAGVFKFTDSNTRNFNYRFYRAVRQIP